LLAVTAPLGEDFCVELGSHEQSRPQGNRLFSVAADCLNRATFHCFLAKRLFLRGFRLLVNVGVPAIVVASEVGGRGLAAEVAIDALVIDEEFAGNVLRIFVCDVSHIWSAFIDKPDKRVASQIRRKKVRRRPRNARVFHGILANPPRRGAGQFDIAGATL